MTERKSERDWFTLALAFLLMAAAFAGSYSHVVDAVVAWGQTGWLSYAIAGMPEVTVIIGMRRVLTGTMTTIMWVFLSSAGMFTLAGNLHGAQHTIGGVIAAGWPAWSAIGALIFAGVHTNGKATGDTETRTGVELKIGRQTTTRSKPIREVWATPVQDLARVTPAALTPAPDPVTPEIPAALTPTADRVTLALSELWTPDDPLTREIKGQVMTLTGVSESSVKRTAAAMIRARTAAVEAGS